MKLKQTSNPADKASWTEHFYTGKLQVKNGEVETDNLVWASLLQGRGFTVVEDVDDASKAGNPEPAPTANAVVEGELDADKKIEEEIPSEPVASDGDVIAPPTDEGSSTPALSDEGKKSSRKAKKENE
jgi:hypothetical protein